MIHGRINYCDVKGAVRSSAAVHTGSPLSFCREGEPCSQAIAAVNHQLARSSFSTETKTRLCGGGPTINNDGGCVSTPMLDDQIYYSDHEVRIGSLVKELSLESIKNRCVQHCQNIVHLQSNSAQSSFHIHYHLFGDDYFLVLKILVASFQANMVGQNHKNVKKLQSIKIILLLFQNS